MVSSTENLTQHLNAMRHIPSYRESLHRVGLDHARSNGLSQEVLKGTVEASDIDENNMLGVKPDTGPREHVDGLLQCAETAGQHDKGISKITKGLLARGKVGL